MCGICGIYNFQEDRPVEKQLLKRMCSVLYHRGPDDEGIWLDARNRIGFGHRRLSIIDTSAFGHQPMSNEDGSIWITYNGEIYNFLDYRDELIKKGHRFISKTDTEIIIHLYEEYGLNFLEKLNGMFSFALWDGRNKRLLLVRDRIGIKPLHYFTNGSRIVFASEIKAILEDKTVKKDIDYCALDEFFTFKYILSPKTIFKSIRRLPAAHYLLVENGSVQIKQYWDLRERANTLKDQYANKLSNENWCADHLLDLLKKSVKRRMISDVPLGAFLSGGLDSSSVIGLMSQACSEPVKSFSVGFDEESYSELNYARIAANYFNTDHHEMVAKPKTVGLLPKLIYHFDEPFADVSIIPTYLVSEFTRNYVTVSLSGDGGDELFAGYDSYIANKIYRYYKYFAPICRGKIKNAILHIPPNVQKKGIINKFRKFIECSEYPEEINHAKWNVHLSGADKSELYSEDFKKELRGYDVFERIKEEFGKVKDWEMLNQELFVDVKTWLVDDILTKVDRMSMAVSLEVRVPLLDYELVEFAFCLPAKYKLNRFNKKYLFKKAVKNVLPDEIMNRKDKQGFSIPIKNWLRYELKDMMQDLLQRDKDKGNIYFNKNYIKQLIDEHLSGRIDNGHKLWSLLIFHSWSRNNN